MLEQKQLFLHRPLKGQYGDCHRTALACLLDLPVEKAPHFIGEWLERFEWKARGEYQEPYDWQVEQEKWLNSLGYTTVDVIFDGSMNIETLFDFMFARNRYAYYILGGQSPRGTNHSVICLGGEWAWDPHPEGGFLVGPCNHGFWEMTFLLPVSMKNFR